MPFLVHPPDLPRLGLAYSMLNCWIACSELGKSQTTYVIYIVGIFSHFQIAKHCFSKLKAISHDTADT